MSKKRITLRGINYNELHVFEFNLELLGYRSPKDYTLEVYLIPHSPPGAGLEYYLKVHNSEMVRNSKIKEFLLEYLI